MTNSRKRSNVFSFGNLLILLWILIAYTGVSCLVYRFKHPKLTETELFLNMNNILTWNMERVN